MSYLIVLHTGSLRRGKEEGGASGQEGLEPEQANRVRVELRIGLALVILYVRKY